LWRNLSQGFLRKNHHRFSHIAPDDALKGQTLLFFVHNQTAMGFFTSPELVAAAKFGIFAASLIAGNVGFFLLNRVSSGKN